GLLEHLEALVGERPPVAQDVLVQVLAGADTEEEAALEHRRDGRGGLRDHGGMDPDQRAGDAGADADLLGRVRDAAERRPHERAVPLSVDPRVVVVGDEREREAGALGENRLPNELARRVVLGRKCESQFRHGTGVSSRFAWETTYLWNLRPSHS